MSNIVEFTQRGIGVPTICFCVLPSVFVGGVIVAFTIKLLEPETDGISDFFLVRWKTFESLFMGIRETNG